MPVTKTKIWETKTPENYGMGSTDVLEEEIRIIPKFLVKETGIIIQADSAYKKRSGIC